LIQSRKRGTSSSRAGRKRSRSLSMNIAHPLVRAVALVELLARDAHDEEVHRFAAAPVVAPHPALVAKAEPLVQRDAARVILVHPQPDAAQVHLAEAEAEQGAQRVETVA